MNENIIMELKDLGFNDWFQKKIEGTRTLWYYPNIYCGYVFFDKNGLLSGWNEP